VFWHLVLCIIMSVVMGISELDVESYGTIGEIVLKLSFVVLGYRRLLRSVSVCANHLGKHKRNLLPDCMFAIVRSMRSAWSGAPKASNGLFGVRIPTGLEER
jgi:hypothetical protein